MEVQFRELMGNDSITFLGDVELVVKRREQASELIEKIRGKVIMETNSKKKQKFRLTQTERGLMEGTDTSKQSSPATRRRTRSEILPGIHQTSQERSQPNTERNAISCATPYTTISRPFEAKRFIPNLIASRPPSGAHKILRKKVGLKKMNMSIDIKSVKSNPENSPSAENSVKYYVNDALHISNEASQGVFGKVGYLKKPVRRTSGTLEDYYMLSHTFQTSTNFVYGKLKEPVSPSKSPIRKRPTSFESSNPAQLLSLLHSQNKKNMAQTFNQKLNQFKSNLLTRTYN